MAEPSDVTGLAHFHPTVQAWFREAFAEPTEAQRRAWAPIAAGRHTLLLAPTGSGKTLAAFLVALDRLMFPRTPPPSAGIRTLYISPLKALGVDVERNLRTPLHGIRRVAERLGEAFQLPIVGVRTGDTPAIERQRIVRHPPDILITTPESLYLMLTSQARETLRHVNTVIIDEIHAIVATKRGAHLFTTLERLEAWVSKSDGNASIQRIGLSATQRPLDEVARLLGGWETPKAPQQAAAPRPVEIVEAGRRRTLDLTIEVPVEDMAQLGVAAQEVGSAASGPRLPSIWPAIHPRLVQLIREHRSTMLFVNSRRLAERLAQAINEVAQAELARAHHGSIAKEARLEMETRLKQGDLPAIVATSSLELGIDMGAVDLVIQIESPPSIAAGIQRIGRSGHHVGGISKGRIFPKYRADLLACSAAAARMLAGDVEATYYPRNPLDVLAQQVVAIVSQGPHSVEDVYQLVRRAAPFHDLPQSAYQGVLDLVSGRYPATDFAELRPRINWDRSTNILSPRRSTQRTAVLNAGTIPDRGLYGVFLDRGAERPLRVGELDEEMVFELRTGEVFLLGASNWRVTDITRDRVLVVPAPGEGGKMPFWRGDGPGRPSEFGQAIGQLTRELLASKPETAVRRLIAQHGLDQLAAENLWSYLQDQRAATQSVPSDRTIVIESFLDEVGDWRIAILSPFGARVHAPWAMAVSARLREELQVEVDSAWTDDGICLRLPESESPPSVSQLIPASQEIEALVTKELGGTALFASHFRENAARALLLPRQQPGKRVPLWMQRKKAADLLATAAKYPQFPMLLETYRECLRDVFDIRALQELLQRIELGKVDVRPVRTETASPFAASMMFSYTAQFIYNGDAPLAERKAQTLALDYGQLRELLGEAELRALLDQGVLAEVGLELQQLSELSRLHSVDDIHDLLRRLGDLTRDEILFRRGTNTTEKIEQWIHELSTSRRIIEVRFPEETRWIAVEDAGRYRDALGISLPPGIPAAYLEPCPQALDDITGRFARTHTPFTTVEIARRFAVGVAPMEQTLRRLEQQQQLVEGEFLPAGRGREWCDRQVLRQLKRRSLAKLRHQIAPVDQSALGRFLPAWQFIHPPRRGLDGVLDVIEKLQGMWLPTTVWEQDILPMRVSDFHPSWLDELSVAGEILWQARGNPSAPDGRVGFFLTDSFAKLAYVPDPEHADPLCVDLLNLLRDKGALRFDEICKQCDRFSHDIKLALWDLVSAGHVTNDTLSPIRSRLKVPARQLPARPSRTAFRSRRQQHRHAASPGTEGRWRLLPGELLRSVSPTEKQVAIALQLAERYGIVTREWIAQEQVLGGFTGLYGVYKGLEETGRLRRGYFVEGLGAVQFAVSGAEDRLRAAARELDADDTSEPEWLILAATDPANPYGAALPWPDRSESDGRPQRTAGAHVILHRGYLRGYLGRTRQHLLLFGDATTMATDLKPLVTTLVQWTNQRGSLTIAKINGQESITTPHVETWKSLGFRATSKGLLYRV